MSRDRDASRLAAESLADGDPTGWFDRLYVEAASGDAIVPWDSGAPNAILVEWAAAQPAHGGRAMVVGCGLGRDAEFLASLGYATSAFDVAPTAITGARTRHPDTVVDYDTAVDPVMSRLQVLVSGRVQGVGFRDWVRREARSLELVGSATNLADGRVEIIAEGTHEACERLLDALGGSTPGQVTDIAPSWSEATGTDSTFWIG